MRDKEVLKQKAELGKDVRNTVGGEQREQVIFLDVERAGGLGAWYPGNCADGQWTRSSMWAAANSLVWNSMGLKCFWDIQLEVSSRHLQFTTGLQKRFLINTLISHLYQILHVYVIPT